MDVGAGWGTVLAIGAAIWGLGSIGGAVVIWAALVASHGPRRTARRLARRSASAVTPSRPTPVADAARFGAEALHQ